MITIAPVFGFFEEPLEIDEGDGEIEFKIQHGPMQIDAFCDSIEDLERKLIVKGYVDATITGAKPGELCIRAVCLSRRDGPSEETEAPPKKRKRRKRKS